MDALVLNNIAQIPINLIRLEYDEYERDDIVVETTKASPNNYSYYFMSYHKHDKYRNYVRYWHWDHWDRKLTRTS